MKFAWPQKDGSVFKSKCTSVWAIFNGEHKPVHLNIPLEKDEHLVICQRCTVLGSALNGENK